ncbi:MAG: amidohydrolase family protein [Vicinamibacterales bacterium]
MKTRLIAAALGALVCVAPLAAQTVTADDVAIERVTIVDVVKGKLFTDMTVVVDGTRIKSVVKTRPGERHPGTVMDGAGMYVIPGLWDMHVHVAFTNDAARIRSTSALMLPLFIANGVTGVRDMWSNLDAILAMRDAVAAHQTIGPRIATSGPMLDGPASRYQVIVKVTTAEDGRAAVRQLHERGVDFIKTQSLVPRDAYFGIADEAAKLGMRFEGHVPDAIRAREAVAAHQYSFEHLLGVFGASTTIEDAVVAGKKPSKAAILAAHSEPNEKAIIALLAENQVWQCPTILSDLGTAADLVSDPGLPYWFKNSVDQWKASSLRALTSTDDAAADVKQRFDRWELSLTTKLHAAGVPFLAGTDAPAGFDLVPGASLHSELEWLVRAGFTPLEALQTATINPAAFLGRTKDFGTVEPGKIADFVVLASNPLVSIGNTRSVVAVVADGRFYSPTELDKLRLHLLDVAAK